MEWQSNSYTLNHAFPRFFPEHSFSLCPVIAPPHPLSPSLGCLPHPQSLSSVSHCLPSTLHSRPASLALFEHFPWLSSPAESCSNASACPGALCDLSWPRDCSNFTPGTRKLSCSPRFPALQASLSLHLCLANASFPLAPVAPPWLNFPRLVPCVETLLLLGSPSTLSHRTCYL